MLSQDSTVWGCLWLDHDKILQQPYNHAHAHVRVGLLIHTHSGSDVTRTLLLMSSSALMAVERRPLGFTVFSVGAGLALDSTDFCSPSDVVFSLAPAASLFSVWVLLRKLPKLRCGETDRFEVLEAS